MTSLVLVQVLNGSQHEWAVALGCVVQWEDLLDIVNMQNPMI